jgi:hypothetical protein
MNLLKELLEALKPSEYRELVKGWDKTRYEEFFKRYTDDPKAFRIYLPFKGTVKKVEPDPEVEKAVREAGYEIEDYIAGIASKDEGKRKIKIGKLIKDPDVMKKFTNDPKRAASKDSEYLIVISRHPYDIAGMSTDRGWTSCMNLRLGPYKEYVPLDIKHGTIVAYLIKNDDKNINSPQDKKAPKDHKIAFGIEDRVYGTAVDGFKDAVKKWVQEVNDYKKLDGLFEFPKDKLYNDGNRNTSLGVGPTGELFDKLKKSAAALGEIEHPTDAMINFAVKNNKSNVFPYINNISSKLLNKLIKDFLKTNSYSGEHLKHFIEKFLDKITDENLSAMLTKYCNLSSFVDDKRLTPAIILPICKVHPRIIRYLKDKISDDMLVDIVEHNYEAIQHIEPYPSDKLLVKMIKASNNSMMLFYLKNPSKAVVHEAVEKWGNFALNRISKEHHHDDITSKAFEKDVKVIRHIGNPTIDQQKKAVESDPDNIQHIKNPDESIQKIAVNANYRSIKYIKSPTQDVQNLFLKKVEEKKHDKDSYMKKTFKESVGIFVCPEL